MPLLVPLLKTVALLNMDAIVVTLLVLKPLTLRLKFTALLNMEDIVVTLEVSKDSVVPEPLLKAVASLNMDAIVVTLLVLKPFTLRLKLTAPSNILFISVALLVSSTREVAVPLLNAVA